MERLLEDPLAVAACDRDAYARNAHRVAEAFFRVRHAGLQDQARAHRLHSQHRNPVLLRDRNDLALEAPVVNVEHVDGHLHGVEMEPVRARHVEHVAVDVGILVPGESDEAELSGLARRHERLDRASLGEAPLRIVLADDLVDLDEIDEVGL